MGAQLGWAPGHGTSGCPARMDIPGPGSCFRQRPLYSKLEQRRPLFRPRRPAIGPDAGRSPPVTLPEFRQSVRDRAAAVVLGAVAGAVSVLVDPAAASHR